MEVKPGYKRTEVGVIPEDWEVPKVGEISRVIRGASPRPKGDKRYYGGPVPRLMVEDVTRDGKIVFPKVDTLTEEGAKLSRPCKKGTLTIVCSGTVGIPSLLGVDACIHDGFLALVSIRNTVSSDYLYYQFDRLRLRFESSATHGGVFTNLTTAGVRGFIVPLPSTLTEQRAIATVLSDVDALLDGLDRLIEKKRKLKQAAVQELLSGQRRLPGFQEEWSECQLGTLGSFMKGSGVRKDEANTGRLPCVRYGELYTHHTEIIRRFNSHISPSVAKGALRLRGGDILFAGSGETKDEIGKCAALVDDIEAYAGGDIIVLRPSASCTVFLGYYLNMPYVQRQKASRGQGDAVVHISSNSLASITLKLPTTLDEQREIAAVLSDMDAEIGGLEDRRAKAQEIKQGMMQVLLTGEIRLV